MTFIVLTCEVEAESTTRLVLYDEFLWRQHNSLSHKSVQINTDGKRSRQVKVMTADFARLAVMPFCVCLMLT